MNPEHANEPTGDLASSRTLALESQQPNGMAGGRLEAFRDTFLTPLWVAIASRLLSAHYASDLPPDFFIVGLQKAGTYWLTALLDSHPDVAVFPSKPPVSGERRGVYGHEGHFFNVLADPALFKKLYIRRHDGFFSDLARRSTDNPDVRWMRALKMRYCAFVQNYRGDKKIVGEKTPEYVFHLGAIDTMFPDSKKICILRDPRDRAVSMHFQNLRKGKLETGEPEKLADDEVDEYVRRISREYDALLGYAGGIHVLTYEAMTCEPQEQVAAMLDYLGVRWDGAILSAMIAASSFERLSKEWPDPALRHLRSARVGGWTDNLSAAQARRIGETLRGVTLRISERFGLDLGPYLA